MKSSPQRALLASLLLGIVVVGCTATHYRKSADKETYRAIQARAPLVENMDPHFSLERSNQIALSSLPVATNVQDFLGPDGESERGASILKLEVALAIAVSSSRNYQSRKEQLYLSGLSLTLARHQFAPIFSGAGSVDYSVLTEQATSVGVDP